MDYIRQILQCDIAISKRDYQCICGCDHCRFGCGKPTKQDSKNQNHRGKQREECPDEALADCLERLSFLSGVIFPLCMDGDIDHHHRTQEKAWKDSCQQQRTYRGIRGDRIEDQRDRRGNDRPDDGRSSCYSNREILVIACILHRLDFDRPQACSIGTCRTAHPCKHDACQDVDLSQSTWKVTDQLVCESENSGGDTTLVHNIGCEYKERHGQ